ncbi:oxidoreductase [Asanoa ishikariensis]|uniref:Nucleoside-diphosphate-sugar epimerase n=1 Tax=Asanoa ishikariensis TaxID=137265 RepID=A0A1H3TGW4_9ACTN|nr:SDR family oxidoreductase [Asanoa ishikariensis]GIF62451.1 oxidoreductase [Asanoa ishikariensis]SDZ49552.1 Nucleoside-diphosphate-sugar epimerase [Asanoa ishikariensis]
MRVFVTGASGWIGSAVVPELIGAGHRVIGLARSDASAAALTAAGAEVLRGDLDDLDTLSAAAAGSDAVIHLAFKHDIAFTGDFAGAAAADRRAVDTFGAALAGTDRPLVIASGLAGLTPGRIATEHDGHAPAARLTGGAEARQATADPGSAGGAEARQATADLRSTGGPEGRHATAVPRPTDGPQARHATADLTLSLAERGVRSTVLRLPPTVHGDGDNGFMASIVGIARATGLSGYLGDGANRWPAVHRLDAARLFRLALEQAPAGTVLHAVADEGVPIRAVAEVIGRQLDLPVVEVTDPGAHFGWLAHVIALDNPASSALTRDLLDWRPMQPGLLDDLEKGHYFQVG